jgi:hypothetical protein
VWVVRIRSVMASTRLTEMEFGRRGRVETRQTFVFVKGGEALCRSPIPDRYYTILILTYRNVGHSFRIALCMPSVSVSCSDWQR